MYNTGSRALQDEHDSRRLADRLADVKVHARFTPEDRAFVERLDMFFLATADDEGRPTCSYKGGDPGFVRVLDETTLVFPTYDGNGMFLSLGNLALNHAVGLLFVDFASPKRLRVDGDAARLPNDGTFGDYPGAQHVVRVTPREIYPNCPRYIHRMTLAERSAFVPRGDADPPIPGWKRADWAVDVLPADDPARRP
jgi:predicted pyridoxine 5'-phosphate oxidase superfamily flavin-nucleotide-binding protein